MECKSSIRTPGKEYMSKVSISDFKNEWPMEGNELPYRNSLYSTACRFTGNPQAAEDLVQETYMKAFRHYRNFKKGTNFRAWIFKILKNSFINYYRKKNFDSFRVRPLEMDLESKIPDPLLPDATHPSDELSLEMDGEVRQAMAALPEVYRRMVIMKDLEHYSYSEIAHQANIPLGTVMSRLFRGRKMLEKALMSYGLRRGYLRYPLAVKQRNKACIFS
jgi:RNA polymerase sigma-70 factor, ECF subfamily